MSISSEKPIKLRYDTKLPMPESKVPGRKPKLTHEEAVECIRLFNKGETAPNLAKKYNVAQSTIYALLDRARKENRSVEKEE